MIRFTDAVERMREGLAAIETAIRVVGVGAHEAARKLADQLHEFRGGDDDPEDGHHAAR